MIKFYNSSSRKLEVFRPINPKEVKIYVCGITPYDASHLGHAFVFTIFDTLIRFLEFNGFGVKYVQNITDVDDDILKKAKETGKNWEKLGQRWIADLLNDFDFLNIERPSTMPRASEAIDSIIQIIKSLEAKKLTYLKAGNVYFATDEYKHYGRLSRLTIEQMLKISAIRGNDVKDPNKENPLDFILWQKSKKDEPSWTSPWGDGRPGWHIECSAMNLEHLGSQIDIHGGGSDLIFPHHDSEIAQSESYTDKKPFVKYWIHCGMVLYEAEKMSKSLGNLIFIKDLKKKYSSNAIRWLLLSNHYRRPWEYEEEDLKECQKIVNHVEIILQTGADSVAQQPHQVLPRHGGVRAWMGPPVSRHLPPTFLQSLSSDFNTPKALEILKKTKDLQVRKEMWNLLGFKLK